MAILEAASRRPRSMTASQSNERLIGRGFDAPRASTTSMRICEAPVKSDLRDDLLALITSPDDEGNTPTQAAMAQAMELVGSIQQIETPIVQAIGPVRVYTAPSGGIDIDLSAGSGNFFYRVYSDGGIRVFYYDGTEMQAVSTTA
jgi:hypothetical protein